jgi:acyl carrier protein
MNKRDEITIVLINTISDLQHTPVSNLNENVRLHSDLRFDSLDFAELTIEIERTWKIDFLKVAGKRKIKTIKDIVDIIYENTQAPESAPSTKTDAAL